ncbi:serine palmitoyltransferase [Gautieria morchelliformis]|nr:serine palmitoyltransferase [Gautieria morchelliformis]
MSTLESTSVFVSNNTLEPLFTFLQSSYAGVELTWNQIPGSAVITRYIRSSHRDDPGRTILEILLFLFAVRTLLQSRTRAEGSGKNFVKLSEKEIDELVDEWTPEPLVSPLDVYEQHELSNLPVIQGPAGAKPKLVNTGKTALNLASYNFTGLVGDDRITTRAIETLRNYGLGSCGPPGFYGTLDVHMTLEQDIASFLGTESAIIYSQAFSTISSVIPAFCKRGDIIVADRGINFAIHKGIQVSRSTVRWYDHNDLKSLEEVLQSVEKERIKKRLPLTRRFIVTEGIFENDAAMIDLPKIIALKHKYKFRLCLDESISFGTVGRTGRGLTELYNVPATEVDLLVGSLATGLCAAGGFCAGTAHVVDHQRINGTAFVFSAAMPALLAVSASEAIQILTDSPSTLGTLHENVRLVRSILDKVDGIYIPSHPAAPIIHIQLRPPGSSVLQSGTNKAAGTHNPTASPVKISNPQSVLPAYPLQFDVEAEERLLQDVVDEALSQGVLITRAKRLRGQEVVEPRPSIKLAITAALSKKDTEKAAQVIKHALVKILAKRRKLAS